MVRGSPGFRAGPGESVADRIHSRELGMARRYAKRAPQRVFQKMNRPSRVAREYPSFADQLIRAADATVLLIAEGANRFSSGSKRYQSAPPFRRGPSEPRPPPRPAQSDPPTAGGPHASRSGLHTRSKAPSTCSRSSLGTPSYPFRRLFRWVKALAHASRKHRLSAAGLRRGSHPPTPPKTAHACFHFPTP